MKRTRLGDRPDGAVPSTGVGALGLCRCIGCGPPDVAGAGDATGRFLRLRTVPRTGLDLWTYRSIMADGTWGFIVQAVIATRGYAHGLDAGLLLLGLTEVRRPELSAQEVDDHSVKLYTFVLEMLDRLDQWEDYLAAWHQLRAHTTHALTYEADDRRRPAMSPYILRDDGPTWLVHFLWPGSYRLDVIARKARARRQGRRLGQLFHPPQSELTAREIQRRLHWVAYLAQEAKKSRARWAHWRPRPAGAAIIRERDQPPASW